MTAEKLLSRLHKVRRNEKGYWTACCPAHDDKYPSLNVTENDEGIVLVHCFAGCSYLEIVSAVGLDPSDLFPPRLNNHGKPKSRPFPAADCLRAVGFEALVVAAAAKAMAAGVQLPESDIERLILAASNIQAAVTAAGVANG